MLIPFFRNPESHDFSLEIQILLELSGLLNHYKSHHFLHSHVNLQNNIPAVALIIALFKTTSINNPKIDLALKKMYSFHDLK